MGNKIIKIFAGVKTIEGELISQGIRVQRHRLRDSIKRIDPIGRRLRAITAIKRRAYNVRSPLALWHLDGNHKLIRYGFLCKIINGSYEDSVLISNVGRYE